MRKLKKIIIPFVRFIFKQKNRICWVKDLFVERSKASSLKNVFVLKNFRSLILAPHSDDEWIGCSQIIANNKNVLICNMDMEGGDSIELHALRFLEMKCLADRFNRSFITVDPNEKIADLRRILNDFQPDVVFVPFFMDWHEEHIQVMKYLKDAIEIKKDFLIGMYPVSLPIPPTFITHYNVLTKDSLKSKWNVFKDVYKTQKFIPWKRFAANERINGAFVNGFAAEMYSVISIDEWKNLLDFKLLSTDERSFFKKNLNKVSFVRKAMMDIWEKKL